MSVTLVLRSTPTVSATTLTNVRLGRRVHRSVKILREAIGVIVYQAMNWSTTTSAELLVSACIGSVSYT